MSALNVALGIARAAHAEVLKVLHHDVRGVLRACEAGLDQRETGLHHEDEYGRDKRPYDIEIGLYKF